MYRITITLVLFINVLIQSNAIPARQFRLRSDVDREEQIGKFMAAAETMFSEASDEQLDEIIELLPTCADRSDAFMEENVQEAFQNAFEKRSATKRSNNMIKRFLKDFDYQRRFRKRNHDDNLQTVLTYAYYIAQELPDDVLAWSTEMAEAADKAGPKGHEKFVQLFVDIATGCADTSEKKK